MNANPNKLKYDGKCDYCEQQKTSEELGFLPTYDAIICVDCYEDHYEPTN